MYRITLQTQCFGLAPSTYRFLDARGTRTIAPSNDLSTLTWQPNRLVAVKPKARSNKSSSSSFARGNLLYRGCYRITWQVEQARLASQAPSRDMSFFLAIYKRCCPSWLSTTFVVPSLSIKVILTVLSLLRLLTSRSIK